MGSVVLTPNNDYVNLEITLHQKQHFKEWLLGFKEVSQSNESLTQNRLSSKEYYAVRAVLKKKKV